MQFALCSLWSSTGPRCSASWPVWTRRTVTRRGSERARCQLRQRHDSGFPRRQHGRYGLGRLLQRDSGLAHRRLWQWHVHGWVCWLMQFALCSLRCRQARQQVRCFTCCAEMAYPHLCAEMASLITVTVFRLPRGTPLVMVAVSLVQLTPAPFILACTSVQRMVQKCKALCP